MAVAGWLLWTARPAFLPPGHGPDLTHHLMLIDFIDRHWRLPHDPALEAYLGEFLQYTPGSHLLASLAGAWTGTSGFRAAHPILVLSVALKAGFVFLAANRIVRAAPVAIAAVALLFAPRAYFLGSFMHDYFFAQVVGELFAVAAWWALIAWDDCEMPIWSAALVVAGLAGTALFLTWPIWIGPVLLTFATLALLRETPSLKERVAAFAAAVAPIAVTAAIYIAGRLRWVSIVRTTGGVTWPTLASTGWIFPVLAAVGFVTTARRRRSRPVILFAGAIALQAAVLFLLAGRRPPDTPYMALKMAYLAVYPLSVCGAVAIGLLRMRRPADAVGPARFGPYVVCVAIAVLAFAIVRQTARERRDAPVVSLPLYRAGLWAREHIPAGSVEYLVPNADTAYWLHLAVLGNPRLSARTAAVETFDEQRALMRWIEPGGLPYAIADLSTLPSDVRRDSATLAQFGTAVVLGRKK